VYNTSIWQIFASGYNVHILYVDKVHERNCDSYSGEVEDISVDEPRRDASTSEVKITDSDSDNSVDIQPLQWMEVKTSDLSHLHYFIYVKKSQE
jgi:hypothetical protein